MDKNEVIKRGGESKMEETVLATIGISSKKTKKYTTSLKKWLSKDLTFEQINYANFSDQMVYATVEFDENNTIYVLVPEEIFKKGKK